MKSLKAVKFGGCKLKGKQLKLLFATEVSQVQIGDGHHIEKDCQVSEVTPSVLAAFVGNLDTFSSQNSLLREMNPKQIKLMAMRLEMSSNLKQLEIFYNNNLTTLPVERLSSAMCSLKELSFRKVQCHLLNNNSWFKPKGAQPAG